MLANIIHNRNRLANSIEVRGKLVEVHQNAKGLVLDFNSFSSGERGISMKDVGETGNKLDVHGIDWEESSVIERHFLTK